MNEGLDVLTVSDALTESTVAETSFDGDPEADATIEADSVFDRSREIVAERDALRDRLRLKLRSRDTDTEVLWETVVDIDGTCDRLCVTDIVPELVGVGVGGGVSVLLTSPLSDVVLVLDLEADGSSDSVYDGADVLVALRDVVMDASPVADSVCDGVGTTVGVGVGTIETVVVRELESVVVGDAVTGADTDDVRDMEGSTVMECVADALRLLNGDEKESVDDG